MRRGYLEGLVIGLFFGFGLGLIAGILFAPAPGTRTRRRLLDEATRMAEAARIVAERAESAAGVVHDRVDHYLGRDEELAWRKVRELREGVQRYTRTQPTL